MLLVHHLILYLKMRLVILFCFLLIAQFAFGQNKYLPTKLLVVLSRPLNESTYMIRDIMGKEFTPCVRCIRGFTYEPDFDYKLLVSEEKDVNDTNVVWYNLLEVKKKHPVSVIINKKDEILVPKMYQFDAKIISAQKTKKGYAVKAKVLSSNFGGLKKADVIEADIIELDGLSFKNDKEFLKKPYLLLTDSLPFFIDGMYKLEKVVLSGSNAVE